MDDLLSGILRIHPEPNRYLDDHAVHRLLTDRPAQYLDHVIEMLGRIADGRAEVERPSKRIFTDPDTGGDFRVMPCVVRADDSVTKTVKIVGTNVIGRSVPDQITVGRAFRLDPDENFISHTFDGCLLSSARTGACAIIALRSLAPMAECLIIVGAGRVGFYTGLYAAFTPPVRDIRYVDARPDRAQEVAMAVQELCGSRCRVLAGPDSGRDPDAMILATISPVPVLEPGSTEAPVVISLGADIETQRELGSGWGRVADIYTDTMDSLGVGDLKAWLEAGEISPDEVTDLGRLIVEGPRSRGRARRVFVSTGSALFDNLTIGYLVHRLDGETEESRVESIAASVAGEGDMGGADSLG